MEYKAIIKDGYILGVGQVLNGGNITKEEFDDITNIIHNTPIAPDGFYYRLKENLEWELHKMPEVEEVATEQDYIDALERLGVCVND